MLEHAFYPAKNKNTTEIHLDTSENWWSGIGNTSDDEINLLSVLIHEIGKALAIGHSERMGSIMYPYFNENIRI